MDHIERIQSAGERAALEKEALDVRHMLRDMRLLRERWGRESLKLLSFKRTRDHAEEMSGYYQNGYILWSVLGATILCAAAGASSALHMMDGEEGATYATLVRSDVKEKRERAINAQRATRLSMILSFASIYCLFISYFARRVAAGLIAVLCVHAVGLVCIWAWTRSTRRVVFTFIHLCSGVVFAVAVILYSMARRHDDTKTKTETTWGKVESELKCSSS